MALKYYADMNDTPVSDLLVKASINTEYQSMKISDSSLQYCTDTGINTGVIIKFIKVGQLTM